MSYNLTWVNYKVLQVKGITSLEIELRLNFPLQRQENQRFIKVIKFGFLKNNFGLQ
jgi:hypothetical protein